jgi:hypothetical protein
MTQFPNFSLFDLKNYTLTNDYWWYYNYPKVPYSAITWYNSICNPACNPVDSLVEEPYGYVLKVLIAGVDEKDVQATYDDATNSIVVKSEVEPVFGVKEKTFALSQSIDPISLKASFKDGILTVTCLKKSSVYKIEIK